MPVTDDWWLRIGVAILGVLSMPALADGVGCSEPEHLEDRYLESAHAYAEREDEGVTAWRVEVPVTMDGHSLETVYLRRPEREQYTLMARLEMHELDDLATTVVLLRTAERDVWVLYESAEPGTASCLYSYVLALGS